MDEATGSSCPTSGWAAAARRRITSPARDVAAACISVRVDWVRRRTRVGSIVGSGAVSEVVAGVGLAAGAGFVAGGVEGAEFEVLMNQLVEASSNQSGLPYHCFQRGPMTLCLCK